MADFYVDEFKVYNYLLNRDMKKLVCQGATANSFFLNACIKHYSRGVILDNNNECGCSALHSINHSVVVVGHGIDPTMRCKKYWLVKNSWGSAWGEDGFMRVCRDDDDLELGTCSIRQEAILPVKGHLSDKAEKALQEKKAEKEAESSSKSRHNPYRRHGSSETEKKQDEAKSEHCEESQPQ